MLLGAGILAGLALLAWLGLLLHPARPWDMSPNDEGPPPPDPAAWPAVAVLVPARNEAASLPRTLPALAVQDYPGPWSIVLVDDRSEDGTADAARRLAGDRVTIRTGSEPPEGWMGKLWALQQALAGREEPWLLLTDADILHSPDSLRRLVAEAEAGGLDLVSRMARLRCESAAERLLIPAFTWFFTLLYPLRRVNQGRCAAAAGGCVLLRRAALEKAGGLEAIRDRVIDDVSLARRVRDSGGRLHLSLSRTRVRSLREYGSIGSIGAMVRRTAFTQLRRSWLLLAGTLLGLGLLFLVPPLAALAGILHPPARSVSALGLAGCLTMAWVYLPALRFFGLSGLRACTLPLVGLLYGAMTLASAFSGSRSRWR